MIGKSSLNKKLNITWLAYRDLARNNFWFIMKLVLFLLWGMILINLGILYSLDIKLRYDILEKWVFLLILISLNLAFLLFSYTLFSLTTKKRQDEFGILRSLGARRSEIFHLILQESVIIPVIVSILILVLEIFLLLYYRLEIHSLFNIEYGFAFFLTFGKFFFLNAALQFLIIFFSLFPSALYFSRLDPYYILRY
ncbi:MAG: FtsX-like permease family protein [Spirochaetes bacterium]|nr:FtsX-like permease family protein [Spirochaetota bacterium]